MAVLGPHGTLSASEIVERSSMDKVNVSRAIKKLQKTGYLKRDIDGNDKRKAVLRLTEEGRKIHLALIPMIKDLEQNLLEGLTKEEVEQLKFLMEKVRLNAEKSGTMPR
jgi:DNA-binding MarR family transcriptional regulator